MHISEPVIARTSVATSLSSYIITLLRKKLRNYAQEKNRARRPRLTPLDHRKRALCPDGYSPLSYNP